MIADVPTNSTISSFIVYQYITTNENGPNTKNAEYKHCTAVPYESSNIITTLLKNRFIVRHDSDYDRKNNANTIDGSDTYWEDRFNHYIQYDSEQDIIACR